MKLIFTLWMMVGCYLVHAQVPYPAAPLPATNIIKAEYFFDTDPGIGFATPIAITPATVIANLSASLQLNALAKGFHRIYIRTMDGNGRWSLSSSELFNNSDIPPYGSTSPLANIAEVEYFIDNDPGTGKGNKISITPATGISSLSTTINLIGVAPGTHRLFIRSKDASGKWSLTNYSLFDNTSVAPYPNGNSAPQPIAQLEYFIDNDPGIGNGQLIPMTASADINNLSVNVAIGNLSSGKHTLYVRSRSLQWSMTAYSDFGVNITLPLTWLYVKGIMKNNTAEITWSTAREMNTEQFVVEHSVDGILFTTIGNVPAKNSSDINNYNFVHSLSIQGFSYYRIKQIDKDGRFTYSQVIALLVRNEANKLVVGPNPATTFINIIPSANEAVQRVEIHTINGTKLKEMAAVAGTGQVINVDVKSLSAGIYLMRIIFRDHVETRTFIKN